VRTYWILLGAALLVRACFFAWDGCSDDLYRYVWEGRVQWEGMNPYGLAPDDAPPEMRGPNHHLINHGDFPAIYPPLAQWFFVVVTGIGCEETGMRNAVLLIDMALCVLLLEWLRRTGRPLLWSAVYLLHPLVILSVGTGHNDPLMLVPLVGGVWAWERRRDKTAAALLGAAILAKTVAVLAVPWFLLRRPRETLTILIPVVLLGYLPYVGADATESLVRFGTGFAFNGSFFRLFELIAPGYGTVVAAIALAAWVGVVTVSQPWLPQALVLLFAGLLLLSPTVHTWYLGWFLVLLPAIGPRPWTWPLAAWSVSALLVSVTYVARYAGGPFEERWWVTVVEYAVPAAVAGWLFVRYRIRRTPVEAPRKGAPGSFGVVIPCRGERANLAAMLPRWIDTPAHRIIVADTPTGDGTRDLCRGELRLRYLEVREPGYGAAVQAGLAKLRGEVEIAVVCDADHPAGPRQVESLLAPFSDRNVGLVCAARRAGGLTLPQRFGNALACFLIALGWGRRFADLGPFRALRLPQWPNGSLRDKGFGWNVEMNVRAIELGMKVVEVELPASERTHGKNRISGTLRGVLGAGWGILTKLYALREESCGRPSSS
jgi:hypothetical protein